MSRTPRRRGPVPRALILSVAASILLLTGLTPVQRATPASATTAQTMTAQLLSSINSARVKNGLGTLRTNSQLYGLAAQRAATLASLDQLSHEAAGCLSCQLAALGISYSLTGEVLAANNYTWGTESAGIVFDSWRNSASHWDILMSARMDTIGIGVAMSTSGTTYASAILIDAPGVTAPHPTKTRAPIVVPHTPAPPPTPKPTPEPAPAGSSGGHVLGWFSL